MMFDHVTAYPNGDIVYEYKDTIVTERKDALPITTIKLYKKELHESNSRVVDIRSFRSKSSPN